MMFKLFLAAFVAVAAGEEEIDQFRHYEPCQSHAVNEFYNTRSASTGMTHSQGDAADKCNALRRGIESGGNINLLRCPCYETVSSGDADKYLRCKISAGDPESQWDTWKRCQHHKVGQESYNNYVSSTEEEDTWTPMAAGAGIGFASVAAGALLVLGIRRRQDNQARAEEERISRQASAAALKRASNAMDGGSSEVSSVTIPASSDRMMSV